MKHPYSVSCACARCARERSRRLAQANANPRPIVLARARRRRQAPGADRPVIAVMFDRSTSRSARARRIAEEYLDAYMSGAPLDSEDY